MYYPVLYKFDLTFSLVEITTALQIITLCSMRKLSNKKLNEVWSSHSAWWEICVLSPLFYSQCNFLYLSAALPSHEYFRATACSKFPTQFITTRGRQRASKVNVATFTWTRNHLTVTRLTKGSGYTWINKGNKHCITTLVSSLFCFIILAQNILHMH